MNNKELKQAIIDDIEFLKTANIEIMDKEQYYGQLKHYSKIYFFLMFGPILFFGLLFNYHKFFQALYLWKPNDLIDGLAWIAVGLFSTLLLMPGFFSHYGRYLIFKEQLLSSLKTKNLLQEQLEKTLKRTYIAYVIWIGFWLSFCHPLAIFFIQLFGIGMILMVTYSVLEVEINRIGASVFFNYLKKFFEKKIDGFSSIA